MPETLEAGFPAARANGVALRLPGAVAGGKGRPENARHARISGASDGDFQGSQGVMNSRGGLLQDGSDDTTHGMALIVIIIIQSVIWPIGLKHNKDISIYKDIFE